MRMRSPNYPNISLPAAIKQIEKSFAANRRNQMDRNSAAISIGYSGQSGAADKTIATLTQYGLLEKAGKGEVRISQLAVEILHPTNDQVRRQAINSAAFRPQVFADLRERFPDGHVSEATLLSYLVREDYQNRAIRPITKSYLETCAFLRQENAYESYGISAESQSESSPNDEDEGEMDTQESPLPKPATVVSRRIPADQIGEHERVVFVEEGAPGQTLKLLASGDLDDYLLEALEDFVKRQRKRLTKPQ